MSILNELSVASFAGVTIAKILSIPIERITVGDNCKLPLPIRNPCPPIGDSRVRILAFSLNFSLCFSIDSINCFSSKSVPIFLLPIVISIPNTVMEKPIDSPIVRNVPPLPQITSVSGLSSMTSPR